MTTPIEPATTASVTLSTTRGELKLELWAKEIPQTCHLFLTRCINGDFTGHNRVDVTRLFKGELVQFNAVSSNSSSNSGHGHDDFGFPRKELHSRLNFTARTRGYIGAGSPFGDGSNNNNNNNDDGFFITLGNGPRIRALNGRYTVFGKVVGDSIYTLSKIEDGAVQEENNSGKPITPIFVTHTVVTMPYFEDLAKLLEEKRAEKEAAAKANAAAEFQKAGDKKKPFTKKAKVRLSYDDDDEEGTSVMLRKRGQQPARKKFKMKSAHEVMDDKSLVIEPLVQTKSPSPEPTLSPAVQSTKREVLAAATVAPMTEEAEQPKPALPTIKEPPKTAQQLEDEFETLKATLKSRKKNHANYQTEASKEKESLVDKERAPYLRNKRALKKGSDKREAQTLALLNKFTAKMGNFSSSQISNPSNRSNRTATTKSPAENTAESSENAFNSESEYEEDDNFNDVDLYSHQFLPQHETSKDDSLITQFTGTKHNDEKFSEADPEHLLGKTLKTPASKLTGARTGALASTQKLREELRKKKLEKIGD
jgi:peptidyl-prolyl cis-trans isomerase SDCCAG10